MQVEMVVVAAGNGIRMGLDKNKPYQIIDNNSVLLINLKQFLFCSYIKKIIIVYKKGEEDFINQVLDLISEDFNKRSIEIVITVGGDNRMQSVCNGLKLISDNTDYVFVHDGVRPFVNSNILKNIYNELPFNDVIIPCTKISDTIRRVDDDSFVLEDIDRVGAVAIQTPQAYSKFIADEIIKYMDISKLNLKGITDDVSLIKRIFPNQRIKCVEGSKYNIKLTYLDDLEMARFIYSYLKEEGLCV